MYYEQLKHALSSTSRTKVDQALQTYQTTAASNELPAFLLPFILQPIDSAHNIDMATQLA